MLTRVLFAAFLLVGAVGAASAQDTTVVALGLTDHVVTEDELVSGADLAKPRFNSPGVAYVLVAHAQKGDKIEIHLTKDGESLMHNVRELAADEDGVLVLAGKTGVPAGGWPEGNYTAKVKVMRGGEMLAEQETEAIPFE
jgi:deoxycytidylate deaminase